MRASRCPLRVNFAQSGSTRDRPLSSEGRSLNAVTGGLLTALSGSSRLRSRASGFARNVWTGCRSQVRWCCRKSLICIRPVDRRAGRGLDGNTHAPLISLADRPSSGHSGHQIQGASIDPFHADPQLRTWSRQRLDRHGLKMGIEGLVVAQDAPGDTGELVGQGDGELVPVQSLRCRL
jgi:hypothetical protein